MMYLIGLLVAIWVLRRFIMAEEESFAKRVGLAIDDFVSLFLFRNIGVTVSAQTGLAAREGKLWAIWLCKFLNLLEKDHCEKAIVADRLRLKASLRKLGGSNEL